MSGIQDAAQGQSEAQGIYGIIQARQGDFTAALPRGVNPVAWMKMAETAFRRDPNLERAAANDIARTIQVLMECARLGHTPTSDRFYLHVRKEKGTPKVVGSESYRGMVARMLNSGVIQKVVAEAVCRGDVFEYTMNVDDRPRHSWQIDNGKRGEVYAAYAYAVYKDGTTSHVALVDSEDLAKAKSMSQGSSSQYSPWNTSAHSMARKTAIRALLPYVEASSEDRRIFGGSNG